MWYESLYIVHTYIQIDIDTEREPHDKEKSTHRRIYTYTHVCVPILISTYEEKRFLRSRS